MLLSPYRFDGNTYYCKHLNEKNLELFDILTDSKKYISKVIYGRGSCHVCANCVPSRDLFEIDDVANNVYSIGTKQILNEHCIRCHCVENNHYWRHLLLGKFVSSKYCGRCLLATWMRKTCEDCGEIYSDEPETDFSSTVEIYSDESKSVFNQISESDSDEPGSDFNQTNEIFRTICDSCLLMKSKELHYCTYYLDYNTDITNIIIDQLQEIKNYSVIKN
jgi:hypothetical protein